MTTMTHEKYNEVQKKMDKLYSDFVDVAADIETDEDIAKVSEWVDDQMDDIFNWANTDDEKEMCIIIEELSELENRFHFLTKDAELFQKITGLMDIYN